MAAGCSKKSGSWYQRSAETIVVLNLQKSQYGLQYYVNVAIGLRTLGDEEAPKVNKCQVQTRLTQLVPADLQRHLTELLVLDSALEGEITDHLGYDKYERAGDSPSNA